MPFPNIEGKYRFPAIYSLRDLIMHHEGEGWKSPKGIIFNYQPALIPYISGGRTNEGGFK